MQQRKLGVLGFIQKNLCGFLKSKPPVAILMIFILSLSLFLLVLSYYVQKNDIVDAETTQVGIFFCNFRFNFHSLLCSFLRSRKFVVPPSLINLLFNFSI